MNFNLTKPCAQCPFRHDIPAYLRPERAEEIMESLVNHQASFPCHKTLVPSDDDFELRETKKTEHCAGALIMLESMELPNQMMRIAERLSMYDRRKLEMDAPVFDSPNKFIEAQN